MMTTTKTRINKLKLGKITRKIASFFSHNLVQSEFALQFITRCTNSCVSNYTFSLFQFFFFSLSLVCTLPGNFFFSSFSVWIDGQCLWCGPKIFDHINEMNEFYWQYLANAAIDTTTYLSNLTLIYFIVSLLFVYRDTTHIHSHTPLPIALNNCRFLLFFSLFCVVHSFVSWKLSNFQWFWIACNDDDDAATVYDRLCSFDCHK